MGKPYSLDLRERICAYVAKGNSARSAGRIFGVSAATAVRFAAAHRDHGAAAPKPQGRPAGRFGKLAPHRDFLLEIVRAEPDITLKELAAALSETYGVDVQLSSLHRALERAGLSYKKGLIAAERDRPALRQARRDWIMRRQPRMRQEPRRLVFIPSRQHAAHAPAGQWTKRRSRPTSRGCVGEPLSGNGFMAQHRLANGARRPLSPG